MIARVFIRIYNGISFTFAVALFTTAWSWIASFYGFYFVFASVNFTRRELHLLSITLLIGTGIAVFFHLVQFGLFHPLGYSGFPKGIRMLNRYFHRQYLFTHFSEVPIETVHEVYRGLVKLPRYNLISALVYTNLVIMVLVVQMMRYSGEIDKVVQIITGGIFAGAIIAYFTSLITEYFIGPYKVRIEQILFERDRNAATKDTLSFRYKSLIMLLLVLSSMIVLMILIRRSDKPFIQIVFFMLLSLAAVGLLLFLMINTISITLRNINTATRRLAGGGDGIFFPPFSDKEFIDFAEHYNKAAIEIREIRNNLENRVRERTEELRNAYNHLNKAYSQIQTDLQMAKRIQRSLMSNDLHGVDGLFVNVGYYPMSDVGGDFYSVDQIDAHSMRIFLADAIGHGVQAALLTMIIKGEYEKVKHYQDSAVMLQVLNNSFIDLYYSLNAFFSCVVIDIDTSENRLRYVSAGHPDQFHLQDGAIELLRHTGKLIGISRDSTYTLVEKSMRPTDKVLLYTDGLVDQVNSMGDIFSDRRVLDIVQMHHRTRIDAIQEKIIDSLREFVNSKEVAINDDITFIGIERY